MKADSQGPDEFERLVQNQTLRQIPTGWRAEIIGAAQRATQFSVGAPDGVEDSGWRRLRAGLRSAAATLFWPSPVGWGVLATVWVVLIVVNHQVAGQSGPAVAGTSHLPAELSGAWKEQERLLTELLGARDAVPAPSSPVGRSRSGPTDHSLLLGPKLIQHRV